MFMSPVRLRSEKVCSGDAQQKLKTKDPTSCQKGRLALTNAQLSKMIKERKGKIGRGSKMGA
jgi:hypothetical protein